MKSGLTAYRTSRWILIGVLGVAAIGFHSYSRTSFETAYHEVNCLWVNSDTGKGLTDADLLQISPVVHEGVMARNKARDSDRTRTGVRDQYREDFDPWVTTFQLDANNDCVFSVLDILRWPSDAFYLPGDLAIYELWGTGFGKFFEITGLWLRGWMSALLSLLVWGAILLVILPKMFRCFGLFSEQQKKDRTGKKRDWY